MSIPRRWRNKRLMVGIVGPLEYPVYITHEEGAGLLDEVSRYAGLEVEESEVGHDGVITLHVVQDGEVELEDVEKWVDD